MLRFSKHSNSLQQPASTVEPLLSTVRFSGVLLSQHLTQTIELRALVGEDHFVAV